MLYLVDNTIDGQGASPRELRAALERIRPGLEIVVEPYSEVSLQRIQDLSPSHIVLSGQSHPWDIYPPESLAGLLEVIYANSVDRAHSKVETRISFPVNRFPPSACSFLLTAFFLPRLLLPGVCLLAVSQSQAIELSVKGSDIDAAVHHRRR